MSDRVAAAHRQIARGAGVVMVGMALSSLAGLASTILVSHAFGTSRNLDAFYAANRLTEILFNLMAGGALASAFSGARSSSVMVSLMASGAPGILGVEGDNIELHGTLRLVGMIRPWIDA